VHDRDKTGTMRIRCSAVRESGSCSNRRIVYLRDVERAVLNGMQEELKDPRLIEAYARNYNEERQRLAASSTSTRTKLEGKRDRIESERQRNIDLVVKQVIGGDDARASPFIIHPNGPREGFEIEVKGKTCRPYRRGSISRSNP
jgi:site-specific DNA recombinase